MEKVIYLEADEEITSVIDRIKNVNEDKVSLVLPKRSNLLQSIVNLKLLKRQVDALNKEVIIVTTDKLGRNLAAQVGFMVYQKLGEKAVEVEPKPIRKSVGTEVGYRPEQEARPMEPEFKRNPSIADITYRKEPIKPEPKPQENLPVSNVPAIHHEPHKEIPKPASHHPVSKPPLSRQKSHLSSNAKRNILIASIAGVMIAVLVCFVILPKAKVTITLKGNIAESSFNATISKSTKSPDFDKAVLPGEVMTLEKETTQKDLACTGKKNIGQKATGGIVVSNSYDENAQSLVENTRFVASNGKTYRLVGAVTVPGAKVSGGNVVAGTVNANVQADEPGEDYNIASSHFTIPGFSGTSKYDKIYADTSTAIKGGFTEEVTVLTQADVDANKDKMIAGLNTKVKEEAQSKYKDKEIFIDGIQPEVTIAPSIPIDTESKKFDLKIKLKYQTLASNNNDFNYLISKKLASSLPADQELTQGDLGENKTYVNNFSKEAGQETVKVDAKGFIVTKIDQNKIKSEIAGKSQKDAQNYLMVLKDVSDAKVDLWPFWVRGVPRIMKKNIEINIVIKK